MLPRFDLWLEKDGKVVLNLQRLALLKAIHRTGAISAAARELGLHYRTAWAPIHDTEEGFGVSLVITSAGGKSGGSTFLTPAGCKIINQFATLSKGFEQDLSERYHHAFQR
jgi:molybdate transport system regulatory protein